jgi:hypothetical protein
MKKIKTIPFDWEKYNNNRYKYKVVTRDGDEVTQLINFGCTDQPLRCVIDGKIYSYPKDGKYLSYINRFDLLLQYKEEVENTESDASVYDSIRADLTAREQLGREKYGVSVDEANLTPKEWAQHAIEEMYDMIVYMKCLMKKL